MLNPRLFLRDPFENVTSQMAVESERERRNWADPPSTRSPLDIEVDDIINPETEASLSRRLIGSCFLVLKIFVDLKIMFHLPLVVKLSL